MTLLQKIEITFALLKSLNLWHEDPDTPENDARLGVAATSMVIAAEGDPERIVLLVKQGLEESRFADHIGRGDCGPHECDAEWVRKHGKRIRVHRARHYWQGHRRARDGHLWDEAVGTGFVPTLNAARLADAYLKQCGRNIEAKFTAQGGGGCRRPVTASGAERARGYRLLLAKWERLAKEAAQ